MRRIWLVDTLVLSAAAAYVLLGVYAVPFHGDEATQIFMSRDFAHHILHGDYAQVRYQQPPVSAQAQELRLINGTINKYLIGLAWHLAGLTLNDTNEQWDWGADYAYNRDNGHMPSTQLLLAARIPSALFTAASVITIFGLGMQLGGRWTAYPAVVLLTLNPAVLVNGRRAMMEGSLLFTSLVVLLIAVWIERRRLLVDRYLLLGIAAGFAVASKHTNALTVALIVVLLAAYALRRDRIQRIGGVFAAGIVSLCAFYALNPAWWHDPLGALREVIRLRANLLTIQAEIFGGYVTWGERVGGLWRQSFGGAPMYYEVSGWAEPLAPAISAYQHSGLAGVWFTGSGIGLLVLLGIGGIAGLKRWRDPAFGLVIGWALGMLTLTLILTPFEWQRYYLPAIPAVLLVAAHGAGIVFRAVFVHRQEQTRDPNTNSTGTPTTHPTA